MVMTWVEKLTADPDGKRAFLREKTVLEATELIAGLMEDQGVGKAELARRLGTSRQWVSQLLDGNQNMTLATLSDVLFALGREVRLSVDVSRIEGPDR
jgi:transcriptional regulator with XRE-family HTH domain